MKKSKIVLSILGLVAATPAFAHPGHLVELTPAGLLHAFTGWDYLLAVMAACVWLGPTEPREALFALITKTAKRVRATFRGPTR